MDLILHKNYFSYQFIEFGQKNSLDMSSSAHDKYTGRRGNCPCKKILCQKLAVKKFSFCIFLYIPRLVVVGIPALIFTIERR